MRLWEYSKHAAHVYVDSVITTEQLPTGDELGDWRLEKTYPAGVFVKGAGQYGDLNAHKMERYAGLVEDSPQRNNSVASVIAAQQTANEKGERHGNRTRSKADGWIF